MASRRTCCAALGLLWAFGWSRRLLASDFEEPLAPIAPNPRRAAMRRSTGGRAKARSDRIWAGHLGITGPQRLVLRLVGRFPGVLAGSLARLLCLHPSTVTGIVNRLEKRGLIQRHTDGADRRRHRLVITPQGAELILTPGETVESSTRRALATLSAEEIATTLKVFAVLETYLTE